MAEKMGPAPVEAAAGAADVPTPIGPMTPEQVAEQLRVSLEQPSAATPDTLAAGGKAGAEAPKPPAKHPLVETYDRAVTTAQEDHSRGVQAQTWRRR